MKLIYQFLYPNNGYLFFRFFEKEKEAEKKIVEVLHQATDRRKKIGMQKIGMTKFLALTLYSLARLTLPLTSAFAFIDYF